MTQSSHPSRIRTLGRPVRPSPIRRGFTLLESLMAAGILLVMVVAVTSAITAGQQHALEAQMRVAGAMAAEELLGRIVSEHYSDLPGWHGYTEAVGTMTDQTGAALPDTFRFIGRDVRVTWVLHELNEIEVNVGGRRITVRAFDENNRTLVLLEHFVVQPAAETIPPDDDDDDGGSLLGGLLGIL